VRVERVTRGERSQRALFQAVARLNGEPRHPVAAGHTALVARLRTLAARMEQVPLDAAAEVLAVAALEQQAPRALERPPLASTRSRGSGHTARATARRRPGIRDGSARRPPRHIHDRRSAWPGLGAGIAETGGGTCTVGGRRRRRVRWARGPSTMNPEGSAGFRRRARRGRTLRGPLTRSVGAGPRQPSRVGTAIPTSNTSGGARQSTMNAPARLRSAAFCARLGATTTKLERTIGFFGRRGSISSCPRSAKRTKRDMGPCASSG
jgi:hypothetical protein